MTDELQALAAYIKASKLYNDALEWVEKHGAAAVIFTAPLTQRASSFDFRVALGEVASGEAERFVALTLEKLRREWIAAAEQARDAALHILALPKGAPHD